MRVSPALEPTLVAQLVDHFAGRSDLVANGASQNLVHTAMLAPSDSPLMVSAAGAIVPKLAEFGHLLFGETLGWAIKEMWVNVMQTGGLQATHNHANSFISGVVYLTAIDDNARTVFMRTPGGADFAFRNNHAGAQRNAYNSQTWTAPEIKAGDMILFPSYLLHTVPPNPGGRRITLSFNAIPTQLNNWGYTISFGA